MNRPPMMHVEMRRKNNTNKAKEAKKNMNEGILNRIDGGDVE